MRERLEFKSNSFFEIENFYNFKIWFEIDFKKNGKEGKNGLLAPIETASFLFFPEK